MLNSDTKRKIDSLRDTLVGKLPTPSSQIEQITYALIYKFMGDMDEDNKKLNTKLFFGNGYSKYAWAELMDKKKTQREVADLYAEAIEAMSQNSHIPELFRDIFRGAYLPFKDAATIHMFLRQINEFSYSHSEELGNAFEYLLSIMGSQGDAGQFRTPRHIIDFIVDVVAPKSTEKIHDPACGTAGFLISAYKYITEHEKNVNSTEISDNFVGYDISGEMVRLSLVNLYLHGFPNPQISEYDTLSDDSKWDEKFDVILANPPFMTPKGGIKPHAKFSSKANRSEVLFVEYILDHLYSKGRAGVIVPEGIIFQASNAYKDLRKRMVEEEYLHAVVSLPSGVFQPYSGVKTSILLFDKEIASRNDEILFIGIENDGFDLGAQRRANGKNDLPIALEILKRWQTGQKLEDGIANWVNKDKIAEDGDFNLTGNRYKAIPSKDKTSWTIAKLKDICEINRSNLDIDVTKIYTYFDIGSVDNKTGKIDDKNKIIGKELPSRARRSISQGDVLLSTVRPNLKAFARIDELPDNSVASTGFAVLTPKPIVMTSWIYYLIHSEPLMRQMESRMGKGAYPSINQRDVEELEIPLPPLSVQEEIVRELDGYQKVIDGAKQVIDNWKPVIDIDPEWEMVELGQTEVLQIIDGDRGKNYPSKSEFSDNGYCMFLNTSNVRKGSFSFEKCDFITEKKDISLRKGKLQREDIVLTTRGTLGNSAHFGSEIQFDNMRINSGMVIIRCNMGQLLPRYMIDIINSPIFTSQVEKLTTGAAQPQLPINSLNKIRIPLPSLEEQEVIVNEIKTERQFVEQNMHLVELIQKKMQKRIANIWGEEL